MIEIKDAGRNRSCNSCGRYYGIEEIMFMGKTGQGISVALCRECKEKLYRKIKHGIARLFEASEIELKHSELPDTLYIEDHTDGIVYPVLYSHVSHGVLHCADFAGDCSFELKDYNKTWRCWNSLPTFQQMFDVGWCDAND